MRRVRKRLALTAAALLLIAGCGDDPAPLEPEDVYVGYLEKEGIVPKYGDAETALVLGHQICDRYDRGDTFAAVIGTLADNGIPGYEAGQINGAATSALCPEHATP